MQRTAHLFLILMLVSGIAGCSSAQINEPVPPARSLTKNEQQIVQSDNVFGLRLFRELSAGAADSNVFVSPLSVSMALGMTLNGARGETEAEMRRTLELAGLTAGEINVAYRTIIDLLRGLDPRVQFEIANSIWHANDLAVEPSFIETNRQHFDAEVAALDFGSAEALARINGWVNEKTHGKISKIIDRIPPEMVMYLINAIYFKAPWTIEFSKDSTRRMDFTHPSGQIEQVNMMYRSGKFRYYTNGTLQVVDLPYGNGRYSMVVMLPNAGVGMAQASAALTPDAWSAMISGLDSMDGSIYLPRLKMEWSQRIDSILERMGMPIAFTSRADFTGISSSGDLYISEVRHKTFVEVNEEGTEAAAVTSVGVGRTSMPERFAMRMDRPFMFAIRENVSGAIMFVGSVVDP